MPPITIIEVGGQKIDQLMNLRVSQEFFRNPTMLDRLQSCAFSEEYRQKDRFTTSPAHSYYMAQCNGEPECLFKVRFKDSPGQGGKTLKMADLSFGRVTNVPAHHGWQYLKAFIERIMVPQGPFLIVARLKSKGGRRAFQDLETGLRNHATAYTVLIAPADATATGYVSNDPLTIRSIRSTISPSQ